MIRQKRTLILALIIALALLSPPGAHPEYNRATKENEFILVSTEQEVKMGKSISLKVEKRFGLTEDPLLQKRINDIGQRIAKVCDRQDISYHFNVIVGKKLKPEQRINAFAVPGGYIYLFEDMVEKMEGDDEVAAILSHEIGHITTKHSIKRLQGSLGAMALQMLTSRMETDNESRARAHSAISLLMLSYSREDEFMADKLGVKYMKLAGYDPEGAIRVIDKMMDMHRKAPIRRYTSYRTHPYLAERKAMVKKEVYGQMEFVDFMNMPQD